jgi:hypothetical protein
MGPASLLFVVRSKGSNPFLAEPLTRNPLIDLTGTLIAYLLYRKDRIYRTMATRSAQPTDHTGGSEPTSLPPGLLHELIRALRSIRYGAIELVIHDGRVVQLEKREKVRLQTEVTQPDGATIERGATMESVASEGRPDYRKPPTSSSREIGV